MLRTKTKKELQEIKDLSLYDDLCNLSDLLHISYVSPYKEKYFYGYDGLYQCYDRPSQAKITSFNILRKLYYETEGIEVIEGLRITGYNCNKYSTNIVIKYNGHEYLIIDTAQYRYLYLY